MRRMLIAAAVAAAMVGLTAVTAAAQNAKEAGLKVFVAQKCTTCHAIAGQGNKKGALDEVGSKLTPAQIREWLIDPVGMTAKTKAARKPAMKKKPLSAADLDALVTLLAGLKKSS